MASPSDKNEEPVEDDEDFIPPPMQRRKSVNSVISQAKMQGGKLRDSVKQKIEQTLHNVSEEQDEMAQYLRKSLEELYEEADHDNNQIPATKSGSLRSCVFCTQPTNNVLETCHHPFCGNCIQEIVVQAISDRTCTTGALRCNCKTDFSVTDIQVSVTQRGLLNMPEKNSN